MFIIIYFNQNRKRQRIPKGQSKMDNLEKLAIQGKQDEEKHNTVCVGHQYTQTNTYSVNKNWRLRRTEHRLYAEIVAETKICMLRNGKKRRYRKGYFPTFYFFKYGNKLSTINNVKVPITSLYAAYILQ